MVELVPIDNVTEDRTNPRKNDEMRMYLLELSVRKLGFMQPLFSLPSGLLLSGHQRKTVAKKAGYEQLPIEYLDIPESKTKGINILFNRATNDFGAFATGQSSQQKMNIAELVDTLESMPDMAPEDWPTLRVDYEHPIEGLTEGVAHKYDKKAEVVAKQLYRLGIKIPLVLTESGQVPNGAHRLFAARSLGLDTWPCVTIPDDIAEMAHDLMNYLSMDFSLGDEMKDIVRASSYRRPQNNRGNVPKAMRFWANGNKTLLDKDSYQSDYWKAFRDLHGDAIVDFGAGLCKAGAYLATKGIDCLEFEPYRIDATKDKSKPDPELSIAKAREFLDRVGNNESFDSIFLCSVLNSVPFPRDRMMVLSIVHALCGFKTGVFGTMRDISDYHYEYSGIRQANYFVFDTEPGVRIGDVAESPKIQKFHSQAETEKMLKTFWKKVETWPGGNVHYFKAGYPVRVNPKVLRESLLFEFDLPFHTGERMGLGEYALEQFGKRLGIKL